MVRKVERHASTSGAPWSRQRALPGSVIAEPEGNVYGDRHKVLRRADGLFVCHEMGQEQKRFRFGPVFRTENEARWRAYHRAVGEKETGLRLGDAGELFGAPATIVDFLAGKVAVQFDKTGEVLLLTFRELTVVSNLDPTRT